MRKGREIFSNVKVWEGFEKISMRSSCCNSFLVGMGDGEIRLWVGVVNSVIKVMGLYKVVT